MAWSDRGGVRRDRHQSDCAALLQCEQSGAALVGAGQRRNRTADVAGTAGADTGTLRRGRCDRQPSASTRRCRLGGACRGDAGLRPEHGGAWRYRAVYERPAVAIPVASAPAGIHLAAGVHDERRVRGAERSDPGQSDRYRRRRGGGNGRDHAGRRRRRRRPGGWYRDRTDAWQHDLCDGWCRWRGIGDPGSGGPGGTSSFGTYLSATGGAVAVAGPPTSRTPVARAAVAWEARSTRRGVRHRLRGAGRARRRWWGTGRARDDGGPERDGGRWAGWRRWRWWLQPAGRRDRSGRRQRGQRAGFRRILSGGRAKGIADEDVCTAREPRRGGDHQHDGEHRQTVPPIAALGRRDRAGRAGGLGAGWQWQFCPTATATSSGSAAAEHGRVAHRARPH